MPGRTRHRKGGQLTVLPAGSRVQTGKARTAAKSAAYSQPLPVRVTRTNDPGKNPVRAKQRLAPAPQSWSQYLLSFVGLSQSSKSSKGKANGDQIPSHRPDVVRVQYDPLTKRIYLHITLEDGKGARHAQESYAMRMLWECGFFGKGTLSRSEPTWRARQAQAQIVQRQRARGKKIFTPEELTALRRKERRAAKIERARLAVRAGQQLADGIVALGGELNEEDEHLIARQVQRDLEEQQQEKTENRDAESAYGKHIPGLIYLKPKGEERQEKSETSDVQATSSQQADAENYAEEDEEYVDVENMETLQLSYEEVLFLSGMLGVLDVVDENGESLSLEHLYALLLGNSLPIAKRTNQLGSPFQTPSLRSLHEHVEAWARPDNPFLLQYVAYHHFRSLGWVVRTGTKFCVDWLLYKRGPAFGHAEFAVVVLPLYEDTEDEAASKTHSNPFGLHPQRQPRDWVWFSSVNRVNTQVLKTLVLCYVVIPPLRRVRSDMLSSPQAFVENLRNGSTFRICEYSVRRFTPQRMRA